MAVLRIQGFCGIVPVTGDRALPDAFATVSVNTWLYGSELRGMRPPTNLIAIQHGDAQGVAHPQAHRRRRPGLSRP